jgi:HSP20 family protein
MTLTRWSPLGGLAALEVNALNRMVEAAFGHDTLAHGAWIPPVDILETADGEVVVKAEVPDVKREDIKITVENNILSLEGERKSEPKNDADRYHRVERSYGAFRRSFTLPANVDSTKVQASYRDGVLTITLPRREEMRPRQIEVK